jgi:hypothetical protein
MGMDASAVATWGLRATYAEIRKTFVQTRTWIGAPTGDRAHDFDPSTGKPNYETHASEPEELERWKYAVISDNPSVATLSDKCVVMLARTCTRSHRSGIFIEKIPEHPDAGRLLLFKTDMEKIGLWRDDHFGLWLYLDISC